MSETALRLVVEGRVQGVGFRYFTCDLARQLELRGWVRNMPDGTVEIAVAGEEATVERFKERLRVGPRGGRVSRLQEEPLREPPKGDRFEVVY